MNTARSCLVSCCTAAVLAAASASAATYTVNMNNFAFDPPALSIAAGDRVTWANNSGITHTSTSGDTGPCTANALWGSGDVFSGNSFTQDFTGFKTGDYPYFCSLHCATFSMVGSLTVTNAVVAPPSVSLTNPVSGAGFRAPASIPLMATASTASGTVTNVRFFSGAGLLGSAANAPFNFTANGLVAGNYGFSAVAQAGSGLSATSSVVNVFVLTNATLSAPSPLSNGLFSFTISGIAGQTYAAEASSDFTNWSAFSTNIAPSNSFIVVDPFATNFLFRFYRARQDL